MLSDLLTDLKSRPKIMGFHLNRISLKNDPFLIYGPGLHNFLRLNNRFVKIFLVMAILSCVKMVIFRSFDGLEKENGINKTANWTFGQIGFPENLCSKN